MAHTNGIESFYLPQDRTFSATWMSSPDGTASGLDQMQSVVAGKRFACFDTMRRGIIISVMRVIYLSLRRCSATCYFLFATGFRLKT